MNAKAKKHLEGSIKRTIRGEEWIRLDDAMKIVELATAKSKPKK